MLDFFWHCVAQAAVELQAVVPHALLLVEPNHPADTALAKPSVATVARLMLRIHFIIPCLLPLGLFRGPSWPIRDRGLRREAGGGIPVDTAVLLHSYRPWLAPLGSWGSHSTV
jgi:hypothetical protein